jgi:hypothetical protein
MLSHMNGPCHITNFAYFIDLCSLFPLFKQLFSIYLSYNSSNLKCSVMNRRSLAAKPNASVGSIDTKVAEEAGRRSMNGRRRHHERSSSPRKLPGPNMHVAIAPLLRDWLLCNWPRTINTILCTGSPSLITCSFFKEVLQLVHYM